MIYILTNLIFKDVKSTQIFFELIKVIILDLIIFFPFPQSNSFYDLERFCIHRFTYKKLTSEKKQGEKEEIERAQEIAYEKVTRRVRKLLEVGKTCYSHLGIYGRAFGGGSFTIGYRINDHKREEKLVRNNLFYSLKLLFVIC